MTAKKVPPKTIKIEGTSMNGAMPPEIIAPKIMPTAPRNPIKDAISITKPIFSLSFLSHSPHKVSKNNTKPSMRYVFLQKNKKYKIILKQEMNWLKMC